MWFKKMRQVSLHWDPEELDKKWQKRWEQDRIYQIDHNTIDDKWYELTMYPYPSGDVHIGHWYAMAPSDAHARFRRMQGYKVFHPMGFDAFGLPAENAAIRNRIHPHTWTMANIERMRLQLRSMGAIYDWDHEIICCDPDYYKWTQYLFLQLYKAGLAYRSRSPAVWCPSCQTGLANEQVVNGVCERCSTPITRRELDQWFLGITRYAEELLDFAGLADWPDRIKTMQRNWIGRSTGVEVEFDIGHLGLPEKSLPVFTTRVDTLYGVTFLVLAPEHPLTTSLTAPEAMDAVNDYIQEARRKSDIERLSTDLEKTGVPLGTYCINPINQERIPIFTSDYVVSWYATGAVMGVPAHDQRDFDFAVKQDLEIRQVISQSLSSDTPLTEAYIDQGVLVNSGPFNGLVNTDGTKQIAIYLTEKGLGKVEVIYRLRDWLISRQRYWGTPIPIIYCPQCGTVPVPENQLPVLLPEDAEFDPSGESPLKRHQGFLHTTCPDCGSSATRETDTIDTFLDSSWYFLRYLSPNETGRPWDPTTINHWLPVDQYTGGAEHAVMHLMYARFFIKALRDLGLVSFNEPFRRLYNQGHIIAGGTKMSKSRGNVITPDPYVKEVGADVVRAYLMFVGPWDRGGEWSDTGLNGIARWLNRIWDLILQDTSSLARNSSANHDGRALERKLHQTIKKVYQDLDAFKFNTAIAALMELSNASQEAWDSKALDLETWTTTRTTFLLLLAPIAPHLAEELWQKIGGSYSIHQQEFPVWADEKTKEETITLVVQVDGKIRDRLEVQSQISEQAATDLALAQESVLRHVGDNPVAKVIYVPGKLVNIVTG